MRKTNTQQEPDVGKQWERLAELYKSSDTIVIVLGDWCDHQLVDDGPLASTALYVSSAEVIPAHVGA